MQTVSSTSSEMPQGVPRVSVVMCTYNRGELLLPALLSVVAQAAPAPPFELIVVDNNSSDGTRAIVERFVRSDGRVRYVFEPQQGLSFARNAGIREARGSIIAFTDDDVRVDEHWVATIVRSFDEHSGADMVGGRVLPLWPEPPPVWLTTAHWAPLALADHGETAIVISRDRPICLVGANLSCRRSVFGSVGVFTTELQRVRSTIGSLEDHEFLLRVLRAGRIAVYDPRIVVHAEVQPDRLQRVYHRRWHAGHGHFHALLRSEEMEQSTRGRFLGVPAHLFRQALQDVWGWIRSLASRSAVRTFHHELRLRFFFGFVRTRVREFFETSRRERRSDPVAFRPAPAGSRPLIQGRPASGARGRE